MNEPVELIDLEPVTGYGPLIPVRNWFEASSLAAFITSIAALIASVAAYRRAGKNGKGDGQ